MNKDSDSDNASAEEGDEQDAEEGTQPAADGSGEGDGGVQAPLAHLQQEDDEDSEGVVDTGK